MATECSSSGESRDLLAALSFKREEKFTRSLGYCLNVPNFALINTVLGGDGYGNAELPVEACQLHLRFKVLMAIHTFSWHRFVFSPGPADD